MLRCTLSDRDALSFDFVLEGRVIAMLWALSRCRRAERQTRGSPPRSTLLHDPEDHVDIVEHVALDLAALGSLGCDIFIDQISFFLAETREEAVAQLLP